MLPEIEDIKESTDFATIYATLFSLSVSIEVLAAIQGLLSERGYAYARNKAKVAEQACNASYKQIERAIGSGLGPEAKQLMLDAVEVQKNILYDFFLLDAPEQEVVRELILKLKSGYDN